MSEHKATVFWKRTSSDFNYDSFDRSHLMTFEGGQRLSASSAPEFLGKKELANPEELYVAACSSCHMLTFLAIAAKSRLTVNSYEDHPVATLEKDDKGVMRITKVNLRPKVIFAETVPAEKVKELHAKAHKHCFVANSVNCEMTIDG